jgi:hypothetical protein
MKKNKKCTAIITIGHYYEQAYKPEELEKRLAIFIRGQILYSLHCQKH